MLALAFGLVFAGASSAATWTVTKLSDDEVRGMLFGISCPAPSLCVAVGADSMVATSTSPTGGRTAWKVFHVGGAHESEPGMPEPDVFPGAQIRGVSCPGPGLCVGVSLDDRVFSSTDPTGGASAWKMVVRSGEKEPHTHMTGVACPAPSLCVAVAYGGKIVHSTNPTGDASAWTMTQLDTPIDFRGVSCPTVSFCVAVGNEGGIAISTDPTGPASAWSVVGAPGGASSLNGVSCATTSLCVTANAGLIVTSTNPTAGLGAWKAVAAGTGLPVKGVSCPTTSACAAVDNNSDVITSTDPTGSASAWSFANVIPGPLSAEGGFNGMFAISCPSVTLCAAAGQAEQIITSTDPFAVEPVRSQSRNSKRLRVLITHHPSKRVKPHKGGSPVTFRFRATGRAARFQCKLHGRRFRACRSPKRYRVGKGTYAFRVRAIAPGGAKGPPTTFHFRVGQLMEPQPVGSCRPNPVRSAAGRRSRTVHQRRLICGAMPVQR